MSAWATRNLRERILTDPGRPGYHFVMPEGIAAPFDPNGAIYWKGRYHLFYIFQDKRSGKKSDHWGHVSSTDLFHWRHHPTGLLEGMYSGNCFINRDGVPTICYHQVDQGNAMAVAVDDDLNEWKKLNTNPITPKTEQGDEFHGKYRSWDPFGWLDGETYYAIFGGEHPGIVKSPTSVANGSMWEICSHMVSPAFPLTKTCPAPTSLSLATKMSFCVSVTASVAVTTWANGRTSSSILSPTHR